MAKLRMMAVAGMLAAPLVALCISPAVAAGLQTVSVRDPSLNNAPAFVFSIPARWQFAGTLYQGGNCVQMPSAVARVTSPDGLSRLDMLPPYGWVYGSGPRAKGASDCMSVTGPMTAAEFLLRLARSMNLKPLGPNPQTAAELNVKPQPPRPGQTVEVAGLFVASQNGSFAIKGLLTAQVTCQEIRDPGSRSMLRGMASIAPSNIHKCVAYATNLSAPEAQFPAVRQLWLQPGMGGHGGEKAWFSAYIKRLNDQSQAMIAQGEQATRTRLQQSAQQFSQMQARAQQFEADQQVRQQMHNQFLSTMQRGTTNAINSSTAAMNARSTAASNVVDYALDRRTVLDPQTGQVTKVSSAYTTTWMDSTGKLAYQTNIAGANPNGVLPGTWTQQRVVNGNGTP